MFLIIRKIYLLLYRTHVKINRTSEKQKTMKKIMEKNKYIQPEISICHVETDQMMACSGPSRFDSPADEHIDVLTNMEKFTDIWGNEL